MASPGYRSWADVATRGHYKSQRRRVQKLLAAAGDPEVSKKIPEPIVKPYTTGPDNSKSHGLFVSLGKLHHKEKMKTQSSIEEKDDTQDAVDDPAAQEVSMPGTEDQDGNHNNHLKSAMSTQAASKNQATEKEACVSKESKNDQVNSEDGCPCAPPEERPEPKNVELELESRNACAMKRSATGGCPLEEQKKAPKLQDRTLQLEEEAPEEKPKEEPGEPDTESSLESNTGESDRGLVIETENGQRECKPEAETENPENAEELGEEMSANEVSESDSGTEETSGHQEPFWGIDSSLVSAPTCVFDITVLPEEWLTPDLQGWLRTTRTEAVTRNTRGEQRHMENEPTRELGEVIAIDDQRVENNNLNNNTQQKVKTSEKGNRNENDTRGRVSTVDTNCRKIQTQSKDEGSVDCEELKNNFAARNTAKDSKCVRQGNINASGNVSGTTTEIACETDDVKNESKAQINENAERSAERSAENHRVTEDVRTTRELEVPECEAMCQRDGDLCLRGKRVCVLASTDDSNRSSPPSDGNSCCGESSSELASSLEPADFPDLDLDLELDSPVGASWGSRCPSPELDTDDELHFPADTTWDVTNPAPKSHLKNKDKEEELNVLEDNEIFEDTDLAENGSEEKEKEAQKQKQAIEDQICALYNECNNVFILTKSKEKGDHKNDGSSSEETRSGNNGKEDAAEEAPLEMGAQVPRRESMKTRKTSNTAQDNTSREARKEKESCPENQNECLRAKKEEKQEAKVNSESQSETNGLWTVARPPRRRLRTLRAKTKPEVEIRQEMTSQPPGGAKRPTPFAAKILPTEKDTVDVLNQEENSQDNQDAFSDVAKRLEEPTDIPANQPEKTVTKDPSPERLDAYSAWSIVEWDPFCRDNDVKQGNEVEPDKGQGQRSGVHVVPDVPVRAPPVASPGSESLSDTDSGHWTGVLEDPRGTPCSSPSTSVLTPTLDPDLISLPCESCRGFAFRFENTKPESDHATQSTHSQQVEMHNVCGDRNQCEPPLSKGTSMDSDTRPGCAIQHPPSYSGTTTTTFNTSVKSPEQDFNPTTAAYPGGNNGNGMHNPWAQMAWQYMAQQYVAEQMRQMQMMTSQMQLGSAFMPHMAQSLRAENTSTESPYWGNSPPSQPMASQPHIPFSQVSHPKATNERSDLQFAAAPGFQMGSGSGRFPVQEPVSSPQPQTSTATSIPNQQPENNTTLSAKELVSNNGIAKPSASVRRRNKTSRRTGHQKEERMGVGDLDETVKEHNRHKAKKANSTAAAQTPSTEETDEDQFEEAKQEILPRRKTGARATGQINKISDVNLNVKQGRFNLSKFFFFTQLLLVVGLSVWMWYIFADPSMVS